MVTASAARKTLRLALAGFGEFEANDIAIMVRAIADATLPWQVVYAPPYDALLLARGTRDADADDVAVLRVASEFTQRVGEGCSDRRQLPLLLPRPLYERSLRLALEAALARLQAWGADPRQA
ncbi:MAG TPA: hypothetical protein PLQ67_08900 [Burkholderiaceae bacterium]|nr:hypothetical protein [Burkholderiaceae bacterium]